ncbi:hypothetical protein MMC15_007475 [Xylographa vitiligo]|nr:hypothetical protein [Xylographa vitiligo]
MPGKIVTPRCGCEFRACGYTSTTDRVPFADMRITAACGCTFSTCGTTITIGGPGSVAAQGRGANDPRLPPSNAPRLPRPRVPQAPPPAPRPAYAQLSSRGVGGHGRPPAGSEFIDRVGLGLSMPAGGAQPHPRKRLPMRDDEFVLRKNQRQKGAGQAAHASWADEGGPSSKNGQEKRDRRGDAASVGVAQSGRFEPDEQYSGPQGGVEDSSKPRPNRRMEEPYGFGGVYAQRRSRTLGSSAQKRRRARSAATHGGEARSEAISRSEARRGTIRDAGGMRNVATKPEREGGEDEEPEYVSEPENPSHYRMDVAEESASDPSSADEPEAQHGLLPRPPHSLQGGTRRVEYVHRRPGGPGPQRRSIQDISRLPTEGLGPARAIPTVPATQAPSLPFRERVRWTYTPMQSRPPIHGSIRAGKQPEKRPRNAPAAHREEAYPQESDDPRSGYSPELGEPGPITGRRGRGKFGEGRDGRPRKSESPCVGGWGF